jgi:hypothetical protein
MTEFRILVIRLQATSSENRIPSLRILSLICRLLDRLLAESEFKFLDMTRLTLDFFPSTTFNLPEDFKLDFKGAFSISLFQSVGFSLSIRGGRIPSLFRKKDIECEGRALLGGNSYSIINHHLGFLLLLSLLLLC